MNKCHALVFRKTSDLMTLNVEVKRKVKGQPYDYIFGKVAIEIGGEKGFKIHTAKITTIYFS